VSKKVDEPKIQREKQRLFPHLNLKTTKKEGGEDRRWGKTKTAFDTIRGGKGERDAQQRYGE